MSETTLALPLSGSEVIEGVAYRVREILSRDCFLSPNTAYESFEAKIHIEVMAKDCGRIAEVVRDVSFTHGEPINPDDEDALLEIADSEIEAMPPNILRQETEQGIPTLVEDAQGKREIKRVTYARRGRPPKEK